MSVFLDLADAMVAHLVGQDALSDVEIVAVRQKDLGSRVREAIAKKGKYGAIGIRWVRFTNPDPEHTPARLQSEYLVAVASKPVLRTGQAPLDNIMEVVINVLHGFEPETGAFPCYERLEVGSGGLVAEGDDFLVYQFSVKAITQLPTS